MQDTTYSIYKNLFNMLRYRGATNLSTLLPDEKFAYELNSANYIVVSGIIPARENVESYKLVLLLIAKKTETATKSDRLNAAVDRVIKDHKSDKPLEIMIIIPGTVGHNIIKKIETMARNNSSVSITTTESAKFYANIPEHETNPPHIIATNEEVREYCDNYYVDKTNFPVITKSSAMAVWLGLRVGEVVRIERVSHGAGVSTVYRICK